MPSETDYKRAFRASCSAWTAAVEPGMGGDSGAADLLVLVGKRIVPIELKKGGLRHDGLFIFDKPGIRPVQIPWHFELAQAGGFSLLAGGEWINGRWRSYFFQADNLSGWRDGLVPIADTTSQPLSELLPRLVDVWGN